MINASPEIVGSTLVFTGTRVLVQTLMGYLKAQNRSVLEFLTQSCQAARLGIEGSSLIPQP